MTTFLYSATLSADGYIAGPAGDMGWLRPFMGADPDPVLERTVPRISALLVGRNTYDGEDPNAGDPQKEGAFEGQWSGPHVLLTHRALDPVPTGVTVVHTFDDAVRAARQAAGAEGLINILGAETARQCLEAELLDEIIISTVPVLLGSGTPFLRGAARAFDLEGIDHATNSFSHTRHYRVLY